MPRQPRLTDVQRELVESYAPLALKLASRRADRSPALDEDDLRQVALEALCESATQFDPDRGSSFAQFAAPGIKGALANFANDPYNRRIKTSGSLFLSVESGPSHEDDSDSSGAFEAIIDSAPAKYRDVLWLTFAVGLTQAEIARRFGVTQPYINKTLRDALLCLSGESVISYRPRTRRAKARHA